MKPSDQELLEILRIGDEITSRGAGLSLRDAIARARYVQQRPRFGPADLVPLIRNDPDLVDVWHSYCCDKRTSSGWFVTDTLDVGRVGHPDETERFGSTEEALAEFIVRELDYWVGVARRESNDGSPADG